MHSLPVPYDPFPVFGQLVSPEDFRNRNTDSVFRLFQRLLHVNRNPLSQLFVQQRYDNSVTDKNHTADHSDLTAQSKNEA